MRYKMSLKNIIIFTVILFYFISSVIVFSSFNSFYKDGIKQRLISENKFSGTVTQNIIKGEVDSLAKAARNIGFDSMTVIALSKNKYVNLNSDFENYIAVDDMNPIRYMNLATYLKRKYFDTMEEEITKNLDIYNNQAEILGRTDVKSNSLSEKIYMKDVIGYGDKLGAFIGIIDFVDEKYKMIGASPVFRRYMDKFGAVAIKANLDYVFLEKIKASTNKEIILIKDNTIFDSTTMNGVDRVERGRVPFIITKGKDTYELVLNNKNMIFDVRPLVGFDSKVIGYIGTGFYTSEIELLSGEAMKHFIKYEVTLSILLFIILIVILKILFKPFSLLVSTIEEIGDGKYAKINIKGRKEINLLVKSINRLSETVEKREYELKELNKSLEIKVEERTADLKESLDKLKLTQEKLIVSEKVASLGKLAGGIAHEINSPLGAILTSTQLIRLETEDINQKDTRDEINESVKIIEDAARKSRDIISKLLKYTERGERINEVIDIKDLVNTSLNFQEKEIVKHKIKIEVEIEGELKIKGNGTELVNVMNNLLENSFHALRAVEGMDKIIKIRGYNRGDKNIIEVIDNGHGMSSEIKLKVFDPFFTTKGVGEGMGLGLTVSYDIIKKHSAEIEIESKEGEGTKVIMSFIKI